jgi:hypothetical protein
MALSGIRVIKNSIVAGPTLSDSQSATSVLSAAQKKLLPPGFFYVGKMLRVTGIAAVSNVVTTPGTLTLDLRLNSTPIVVTNGGAMQMSTTAHVSLPLWFQFLVTCQVVGSGTTAKLIGGGIAIGQMLTAGASADSAVTYGVRTQPNTAPAQGTGFDSTISNILDVFATFSVNTDPTDFTMSQYLVEELN